MRVVVQRVKYAQVFVDQECVGSIQQGLLLLVGISNTDDESIIKKVAKKCVEMRIFNDKNGKMNIGVKDVSNQVLSISQFTLYGDVKKGKRPNFMKAADVDIAKLLYDKFNEELRSYGIHVETGMFQADMKVELLNDGPITIIVDSDLL